MSLDPKLQSELIAIGLNVIFILILFKIINIVDKKIRTKIQTQESNSPLLRFMPIIIKIIKIVLIFLAITGLLQTHGYSMSSIIAGFGIGGLAVGMAAKDTLADVFGSISLLSDKVYKIGDYVKVNGIEGYVEDITIRSTKIRDLDNFLNTIPNNMAANAIVTNVSQARKRLLKITFGVTYSTTDEKIKQAKQLLEQIGKEHKEIHNDFTIAIHDLGDSSINIRFMGYVKTGSYFKFLKVRGEFIEQVVESFRENGIDFAFPSRSIYIESDNSKIEN
ncbi:mechanosensitive ion channel family protein [bacterium]|nr:mechanosensitive ion channel family protein [bacterium]